MTSYEFGEIVLVPFPFTDQTATKKRPAVVVSLDTMGRLPLRIIVPVTDWKPQDAHYPWFVELAASATNGLIKNSGADAFQPKSVSQARFVRLLGQVTGAELDAIVSAIALCVGAP